MLKRVGKLIFLHSFLLKLHVKISYNYLSNLQAPDVTIYVDASDAGWGIVSNVWRYQAIELKKETFRSMFESWRWFDSLYNFTTKDAETAPSKGFFFRQHHSDQVCKEIRKSLIRIPSTSRSRHSQYMQRVQHQSPRSAYCRIREHCRRQTQKKNEDIIRMDPLKEMISIHITTMGKNENRYIPNGNQRTPLDLPEPVSGLRGSSYECFQPKWPSAWLYLYPPWRLIPSVLCKFKEDRLKRVVLITPNWPTQFWWPLILQHVKTAPIPIRLNKTRYPTTWILSKSIKIYR